MDYLKERGEIGGSFASCNNKIMVVCDIRNTESLDSS
jgi:hypothetical protein